MPCTRTFVDESRRMVTAASPFPGPAGRTSPQVGRSSSRGWSRPIPRLRRVLPHKWGRLCELDDLFGRLPSADPWLDAVLPEDLPTLLLACPAHPHDKRDLHLQVVARSDDTLRDLVPARDHTEDVDQDAFDFGVHQDHGQRVLDDLGLGAPTDVAEVRRLTAGALHEVERAHTQARAVADDPDVSVEG